MAPCQNNAKWVLLLIPELAAAEKQYRNDSYKGKLVPVFQLTFLPYGWGSLPYGWGSLPCGWGSGRLEGNRYYCDSCKLKNFW